MRSDSRDKSGQAITFMACVAALCCCIAGACLWGVCEIAVERDRLAHENSRLSGEVTRLRAEQDAGRRDEMHAAEPSERIPATNLPTGR